MTAPATLRPRDPWKNAYWNQLTAYAGSLLQGIPGSALPAAGPLILSRPRQNLDGRGHNIYDFRHWFGQSGNVSIKDVCGYGAKGDGTTDDLAAINLALAEIPATGGCIIFPPGNYKVSAAPTFTNKANVTLRGFGPASIITCTDSNSSNKFFNLASFGRVVLQDLTLSRAIGGHVYIDSSTHSIIRDCTFLGGSVADISIIHGPSQAIIEGCTFINAPTAISVRGDGSSASAYLRIHRNRFVSPAIGVDCQDTAGHTEILANLITGVTGTGIIVGASGNTYNSSNFLVQGNVVASTSASAVGITVETVGTGTCTGVTLKGNVIHTGGSGSTGIEILGVAGYVSSVSVIGNTISCRVAGSTVYGLRTDSFVRGVAVKGNIFWMYGADQSIGVWHQGYGPMATVGNAFGITGGTLGPEIQQGSATVIPSVIVGNTFTPSALAVLDNALNTDIGHNPGEVLW